MPVEAVRMTLTNAATLSPAYTVPNGLKAIIKSIQIVNRDAATALWVLTLTGGFEIARVNVTQNQTIVIDTAQVLLPAESISVLVTGATGPNSVITMISGVQF